jgi:hypothetical protein
MAFGTRVAAGAGRNIADVLEFFYTGLLVVIALLITWFSGYVVYKLYQGQS